MFAPVMWSEKLESRPSTAFATSAGVPYFPSGTFAVSSASRSANVTPAAVARLPTDAVYFGVSVPPSDSVLTCIPRAPSANASVLASASQAQRMTLLDA
jgi:hypothetical protein